MTSSMESRTTFLSPRVAATETDRVGATRSNDVEVGHTMGPPSERPHATFHRWAGLTTSDQTRYTNSAEATLDKFHGTRDTTGNRPPIDFTMPRA